MNIDRYAQRLEEVANAELWGLEAQINGVAQAAVSAMTHAGWDQYRIDAIKAQLIECLRDEFHSELRDLEDISNDPVGRAKADYAEYRKSQLD